MKEIKYFYNIENKWITVKVNNAVAEYLKQDYYREKEQRRQIAIHEVSVDGFESGYDFLVDRTLSPYSKLIEKLYGKEPTKKEIRIKLLKKGLKKLKPEEKFIIKQMFYKNLKKIEISKRYNIIPSTITYRYKSAIKKLKNYILENEKLNLRKKSKNNKWSN